MGFLNETGLQRVWEHILAKLNLKADKTEIETLQTALDSKSDWNQNDTTAVDYIKNRTHWEEESLVTLVENQTVSLIPANSYPCDYTVSTNNEITLKTGNIYTVTISGWDFYFPDDHNNDIWTDSTTVQCKAIEEDGKIIFYFQPWSLEESLNGIEKTYIEDGVINTNNFHGIYNPNDGTFVLRTMAGFLMNDTYPSETLITTIIEQGTQIHKLDNRFLNIATEVTETEENPVSGAAVAAYLAENSNNDAAGKNVEEQTFNTLWNKETETFNTAVANEGAEIFNDYRERAAEIFGDEDDYDVEYQGNVATGAYSHAEGIGNTAIGAGSHAEGYNTIAGGEIVIWDDEPPIITEYDHAEGYLTQAIGGMSHAEGRGTIAAGLSQHVQGEYNIADSENLHIVGNGSLNRRSNAHTLDYDGNAWFSGDVYTGSTSGKNKDEGSKKLATEEYVNNSLNNINNQPDWNQYDETQPDYVKNRTHWEKSEIVTLVDNQVLTLDDSMGDYSCEYPVSSNHEIVLLPEIIYDITINGFTLQCETYSPDYNLNYVCFDFADPNDDTTYSGLYDEAIGTFIITDEMAGLAADIYAKYQITVSIEGPNRQVKTLPSYFLNLTDGIAKKQIKQNFIPWDGGTIKNGALTASAGYQYPTWSTLRNSKILSSEKTPTVNGEIFWTYE